MYFGKSSGVGIALKIRGHMSAAEVIKPTSFQALIDKPCTKIVREVFPGMPFLCPGTYKLTASSWVFRKF